MRSYASVCSGQLKLIPIKTSGKVRTFLHKPPQGTARRLTIKYAVGERYAIFLTKRTTPTKPHINHVTNDKVRGGDLNEFVTFDNAESVEYPKFLRGAEEKN
jgi:hypothetical protein